MSRVDVPTLKCDRCGKTTQDLTEMARYASLSRLSIGGTEKWDLCSGCWTLFCHWLKGTQVPPG